MSTNDDAVQYTLLPETPPRWRARELALSELPPDAELVGPDPERSLVESISALGILEPIKVDLTDGGTTLWRVIDGVRRIKAARRAGLETIPALIRVRDITNWHDLHTVPPVLSLTLNSQRSANPAAELAAIERLMEQSSGVPEGRLPSIIAAATGMPIPRVKERLKLRRLVPELRAALAEGRLPGAIAKEASSLPEAAQRRIAERCRGRRIKGRDVDEERSAWRAAAIEALPDELFDDEPEPEAGTAEIRIALTGEWSRDRAAIDAALTGSEPGRRYIELIRTEAIDDAEVAIREDERGRVRSLLEQAAAMLTDGALREALLAAARMVAEPIEAVAAVAGPQH